jgi:hypothetical protein
VSTARFLACWLLAALTILCAAAVLSERVVEERGRMEWRMRCP